jgi:hypothetical protein
MNRALVVTGAAATATAGYAIAWWLSRMTVYAERRDHDRYLHTGGTAGPGRQGPTG